MSTYFLPPVISAIFGTRVIEMASADASGTVTLEDQRSYIKIETLHGKNLIEIQSFMWNKCDRRVLQWLFAKIEQKNAQNPI